MEMALFGFLRPDLKRLEALERRVNELAASNEQREIAFLDIAERVKRHLQRAATIEQRTKERESPANADPLTRAVLSTKFPQVRKAE